VHLNKIHSIKAEVVEAEFAPSSDYPMMGDIYNEGHVVRENLVAEENYAVPARVSSSEKKLKKMNQERISFSVSNSQDAVKADRRDMNPTALSDAENKNDDTEMTESYSYLQEKISHSVHRDSEFPSVNDHCESSNVARFFTEETVKMKCQKEEPEMVSSPNVSEKTASPKVCREDVTSNSPKLDIGNVANNDLSNARSSRDESGRRVSPVMKKRNWRKYHQSESSESAPAEIPALFTKEKSRDMTTYSRGVEANGIDKVTPSPSMSPIAAI